MERSLSVRSSDSGKAKMQTVACWEPAPTVNVLLLSLISDMWGPGMWGRITSRSVRMFTSSSPSCAPGALSFFAWALEYHGRCLTRVNTARNTQEEAQTLESRSPNFCSVSLGGPVAVNKGKLNCPGLLDRAVDTICSADTWTAFTMWVLIPSCDRRAITVHPSFVATW